MKKWICPNCEEALFVIYRDGGKVCFECIHCGEVLILPETMRIVEEKVK